MRTGIGIDTGGTYTDAVIYDFDSKRILFSTKALTTKDDLSAGIGNALDALPGNMVKNAEIISLCTTLATNACVENKGGYAKLIFIGADKNIIGNHGRKYGLPDVDDMVFLDSRCDFNGDISMIPDWRSFIENSRSWIKSADAVGIVAIYAMNNNAVLEKKARELLVSEYDLPVVCGHELFNDLNLIQRGAGTLLNARLIPVIKEFLEAVGSALSARNITAPVVIVRSDGSVMSEGFTSVRPVETLLSGPAASVMGGISLTDEKDCLVIDMGGTTTDISIVKDGIPLTVEEGINIGQWKTFVKGVYIDTFGLGGDTAVTFDRNGRLRLEDHRVVPLSAAAYMHPVITEKLAELNERYKKHSLPLHEFFILQKDISCNQRYSEREKKLCSILQNGPLIYSEAAEAMDSDPYNLNVSKLEKDGIIMRCGLTPTDIMHLKGDYNAFDAEAAGYGAWFVAGSTANDISSLSDKIYDMVKRRLYSNIVRMLLEYRHPEFKKTGVGAELKKLIHTGWEEAKNKGEASIFKPVFNTSAALVGIGAPTHIFLPDVAKALGTKCVIPEHAGVANALGAVIGNIRTTCDIEIKPEYSINGITGYTVFGRKQNCTKKSMEDAITAALREAEDNARYEALQRGASGNITVTTDVRDNVVRSGQDADVYLGTKVTATAYGRLSI